MGLLTGPQARGGALLLYIHTSATHCWSHDASRGSHLRFLVPRWTVTHQDLHRQQALAGVPGVDGELHGQAGWDPGYIQTRTASPDLAGVVCWEGFDLEGTVEISERLKVVKA